MDGRVVNGDEVAQISVEHGGGHFGVCEDLENRVEIVGAAVEGKDGGVEGGDGEMKGFGGGGG